MEFMGRFQGLIFDCDGTLSDSMPWHYVAWREAMAYYGIEFLEDRFYAMGGMPSDLIIRTLTSEQSIVVDCEEAALRKEAAFERHISQLQPLEEVCDIARRHFGHLPMAVASGGVFPIVKRQLIQLGIDHLFDTVVTAEDTARHKPHPDVFIEAARRLNLSPSNCLVFEDAVLGFEAARAAGMSFIDVRTLAKPRA